MRAGAKVGIPLILLAGAVAFACAYTDEGVGWTALALVGAITFVTAQRVPAVRRPLLVAFATRLVLALTNRYITVLPDAGADAVQFERYGWALAQRGISDPLTYLIGGAGTYYMLIAAVYTFTGRATLVIQAISVLTGTLAVLETYRLASRLWGPRPGTRAAWLVALLPTTNLYAALIMREPIVVYCCLLGVRLLVDYLERRNLLTVAGAMLAFAAGGVLHNGLIVMIPLAGWLIFARTLRPSGRLRPRELLATVGGLALVAGLGVMLFEKGWGLHKFHELINAQELLTLTTIQARAAREAGSLYLPNIIIRTWTDLIWQPPIRVIYFLFTPFPWMIRSPGHIFGLIDSLVYLTCAFNIIRRHRTVLSSPSSRCVLWAALLLATVYAMGTSNFGGAIRHRAKILPLLVILAMAPPPIHAPSGARNAMTAEPNVPGKSIEPTAGGGQC